MPFEPPCYAPEFFFDPGIVSVVRGVMDDRVVADQGGCDVPIRGSGYQDVHADYRRPLFEGAPDLELPAYILVVSFGLIRIAEENGPIEIAPGTHRMPRAEALQAIRSGEMELRPVPLEIGDVLIRHPWTLHRGTPNITNTPRSERTETGLNQNWLPFVDDYRTFLMAPGDGLVGLEEFAKVRV